MRNKLSCCLALIILGSSFAVCFSSAQTKTQPSAQDRSKLNERAPSLKRPDEASKKKATGEAKSQEAIGSEAEDDVVRVDTTLVVHDVSVLNKQGHPIKGLTASDFVVTEDGQPQQVTTFALGDDVTRPRTIVLLIDYSSSQLPYIKNSVEAAKALVDKLNPRDLMAIVTDDVSVLVDFTGDKTKLKKELESLRKRAASGERLGRSSQYTALLATLNKLSNEAVSRPIIFFQTDGDEASLLRPAASYPTPSWVPKRLTYKNFSLADVSIAVLKSKATIYTVVPGPAFIGLPPSEQFERARLMLESRRSSFAKSSPERYEAMPPSFKDRSPDAKFVQRTAEIELWMQMALAQMTAVSGGWMEFLEKPEQAAEVYSRILSDINRRYIIGYQPTNKERDGKARGVRIEVREHPEYLVWGRKSYYAPEAEK